MKASCNREGLLTAFQIVSGVVDPRSPKPILANVKLEVNQDGDAILMATDLELGIRYRISGLESEEPGMAILPTARFGAILRELPDERLELETIESGVRVTGSSSRFDLPGEDPAQFPDVPQFGDDPSLTVSAGRLATMVKRTIFAADSSNSRYALKSVMVELDESGSRAILVATNGKRLALMPGSAEIAPDRPAGHSLVPPEALSLLMKVLVDPEESLRIVLRDNEALFEVGRATIYARLVEGRYPSYEKVIPEESAIQAPLIVGRFLAALRQAKIVTSDSSKGVDFRFSEGMLTLDSRAADVGESEVRLPIGYQGPSLDVCFDPQLLIDALRVLEPEEEVILHLIDEKKAGVLRTADEYVYVVMPLTTDGE